MLAKSLKFEFPDTTGFSERNLHRIKAFYVEYKKFSILPSAVAELPWTHNYILIEKEKDKISVEWALEDMGNPICLSSYKINSYIPKDILDKLPTEEDINLHIDI